MTPTRWITLPLLIGALGAAGCGSRPAATPEGAAAPGRGDRREAAVAVACAPIRRGPIRDVRMFSGSLHPRARVVIAPRTAGRLVALSAQIGDPVEPDQVMARLDDDEYLQQVDQARAALDVATATLEQHRTTLTLASREMERVRALRDRGIASEAEWDRVLAEYEAQQARLRVAQAQLAEREFARKGADVRLAYTRIRAWDDIGEGDWVVEERFVDEGAMIAPNQPILSLVDIGRLTAVIRVIEKDYPLIRVGLAAELDTDAFPGEMFAGTVVRLAPGLREASRQARVELDVPNRPPRLRPGMFVRVRMVFDQRDDALLAPRTALVTRQGRPGVFLVDAEGRARFVPVQTGIVAGDDVEILEPALTGQVVTLGHHMLSDGAAVIVSGGGCAEPATTGAADPREPHRRGGDA